MRRTSYSGPGPVSSAAEAGNLKLVKGNWIGQFLDEAESFPAGEHDDAIDSLSGAHAALTSGRRIFAV
jgi:predicted phage terminase large subunit-like protein